MISITFDPTKLSIVKAVLRNVNQSDKHISGNVIHLTDQEDVVNLIGDLKQAGCYVSAV